MNSGEDQDKATPPCKIEEGRFTLYYTEGDHCLHMVREWIPETDCIEIPVWSLKNWIPPHHYEPISEEKKKQILANLEEDFQRRGKKYKLVYPEADIQE